MEIAVTIISSLLGAIGILIGFLGVWYIRWRKAEKKNDELRMQAFVDAITEKIATLDSAREMALEEIGVLNRIVQQQYEMLVRMEGRQEGFKRDLGEVKKKAKENSDKIADTRESLAKKADK